jgi:hypothetical protein
MNRSVSNGYSTTLGALLLVISLPACAASTFRQHTLEPGVAAAVTGTIAQSVIPVDQLTVVPPERTRPFSLFPVDFLVDSIAYAMLDSTRNGIAQRRIRPLQEQTSDVSFRDQYAGALQDTLSTIGWLKLRRLERRNAAARSGDQRDARLELITSQTLSAQSSVLFVESTLAFYPAGAVAAPGAAMRTLYRSEEVTPERGNKAVSRWAQDRGQAYRSSLAEGIAESMKMTTMALEHVAGTRYSGKAEALLVWTAGEPEGAGMSTSEPDAISGTVVEETATRLILEVGTWGFASLPKSAIGSREVIGKTPGVAWHAPAPTPAPRAPWPAPTSGVIPEQPPAPTPPTTPGGSQE